MPVTDADFEAYHKANPEIGAEFMRRALRMRRAGRRQYGAKTIMEAIRYHTDLHGGDGYKVNNNYTAHYARWAMRVCPELRGFFALRERAARREVA